MKLPTISLKRILEATKNDAVKRLDEPEALDNKAPREECIEWIEARDVSKYQPHVLYANQINIEQL